MRKEQYGMLKQATGVLVALATVLAIAIVLQIAVIIVKIYGM